MLLGRCCRGWGGDTDVGGSDGMPVAVGLLGAAVVLAAAAAAAAAACNNPVGVVGAGP